MSPALIGVTAFVFAFGAVLLGTWVRTTLPEKHLDAESKDVIKLGIGLIATMTALVLGLVTASAKNAFDAIDGAIKESAVKLLVLDRTLARYGPEAGGIRVGLKQVVGERIDMIWPAESSRPVSLDPMTEGRAARVEALVDAIGSLKPRDDLQRALQTQAVALAEHVLQARWVAMAGTGSSVPVLFLVVVVSWLTVIFATFGMFASNRTAIAVLFVCALSIGGALFLILELDTPFDGSIQASSDPIRYAHTHMNR
jgi:protein-S-isoprenylcysteine O-methyltransferase Ste14